MYYTVNMRICQGVRQGVALYFLQKGRAPRCATETGYGMQWDGHAENNDPKEDVSIRTTQKR